MGILQRRPVWRADQRKKLIEVVVGVNREASASQIIQTEHRFDHDRCEVDSQARYQHRSLC